MLKKESSLAEVGQHRVDELECLVDLFTDFGTREHDLARHEDQEHDLRLHHAIDEAGEEFRLVGAEHVMARGKTLQTNGKLDITRPDDVLDLEVGELGIETQFLMMRAYLRLANLESSSDLAPVTTILPEAKINAVVLGSRIRMITAAKRLGLYSALRACRAMVFRSRRQSKFTVATMF